VIEPTAVNLLRRAGELLLYEQIIALRDTYFSAFKSGDKEAARYVIGFLNGNGTFNTLSQRTRDYIVGRQPATMSERDQERHGPYVHRSEPAMDPSAMRKRHQGI